MKKVLIIATFSSLIAGLAMAQAPNAPSKPPPTPDAPAAPPAMPSARSVMLTEQEIRIIIAMGEECIKAKGYDCAEAALMIRQKLQPPPPPVAAPPTPPK